MFFDRKFGLQEAPLGILTDRHEGDTLIHVTEIGIESKVEFACDLAFLLTKLRRERVKDRVLDPLIQVIDVNLLHPLAQPLAFLLQASHGSIVILPHFGEILPQGAHQPAKHAVGHLDAVEHVGKLLEQHLFPNIGFGAFPFPVAAPIVDIFLLFDVAHEEAATVAALDHTGEQEVLLDPANARRVTAIEYTLDALP